MKTTLVIMSMLIAIVALSGCVAADYANSGMRAVTSYMKPNKLKQQEDSAETTSRYSSSNKAAMSFRLLKQAYKENKKTYRQIKTRKKLRRRGF